MIVVIVDFIHFVLVYKKYQVKPHQMKDMSLVKDVSVKTSNYLLCDLIDSANVDSSTALCILFFFFIKNIVNFIVNFHFLT